MRRKDSHYKGNQMNSSVIYFDILIISTSDCDEKVRTLIDNWKLCTKKKINLKKQMQLALFSQVFWFMPLYFVLNFWMYIFSLCFLNWSLLLCTFSIIITSMSLCWCPLELKWSPVALLRFLLLTYPRCSENLDWRVLDDSPIYWFLHFLQLIK